MANFGLPEPATGTDAEMLLILRKQLAYTIEYGHDRMENGRRVVSAPAEILLGLIKDLEDKIAADAAPSGMAVNYARRLRPQ